MELAEAPHSVVVRLKEHPDRHSIALAQGLYKLTEPQGIGLRRSDDVTSRRLILASHEPGKPPISISYEQSVSLDLIAFFREGEENTRYAARNGSYIELGAKNGDGQVAARYDLKTGLGTSATADINAFPYFETKAMVNLDDINLVLEVCQDMREKRTPFPAVLNELQVMIGSIVTTQKPELSFQPQLPL